MRGIEVFFSVAPLPAANPAAESMNRVTQTNLQADLFMVRLLWGHNTIFPIQK
jgi:hypothetical protein